MSDNAKAQAVNFPTLPGVYIMRDKAGEVIYIGKAKNLKSRIKSYFSGGDGRSQIEFLMRRVHNLEKIITESEEQAIILERDLINKHKPRYNIKLKDDKSYLSIRLDVNAPWPRLELVRKVENDGARYFGPYSFSYELKNLLEIVKRVVPLRTCTNTVFHNRQRPCLEYEIKRCAGPCCLPVEPEQYLAWVKQAISVLEGKTEKLKVEFESLMEKASDELRFEDAALYRDRLKTLESFKAGVNIVSSRGENRDVFGLYREEGLVALSVLLVRSGRVSETVNFTFSEVSLPDEEILESAIGQFYARGREVPEEIVLPFEFENSSLLRKALDSKSGKKVDIEFPQRGIKKRLLGLAELNAKEHFSAKFDAEERYMEVARGIAKNFKLKQLPRKIECVDISNFQGKDIVGAIVVFFDGKPEKSMYKRYKLSLEGKPDDFASIYEVVDRRLRRGQEEMNLPDLLIVDGGQGQLQSALRAKADLGVSLDIISLAKMKLEAAPHKTSFNRKPERVFVEWSDASILLNETDEVTKFLQRIRDETHRFVINYHRSSRLKTSFASVLDSVPGLGPERKRKLFRHFGSLAILSKAEPAEIAKAMRAPVSLAHSVLRVVRES